MQLVKIYTIGNLKSFTDTIGNIDRYEYNTHQTVREELDPACKRITFDYNSGSNLTARTDRELGVYYYRRRYYGVENGRFLQEDSIRLKGGDGNFYRHVGNATVNSTDAEERMIKEYVVRLSQSYKQITSSPVYNISTCSVGFTFSFLKIFAPLRPDYVTGYRFTAAMLTLVSIGKTAKCGATLYPVFGSK